MPKALATSQEAEITDTGSTLRDISPYLEEVVDTPSRRLHDDTAPGSDGDQFFPGIKNGGVTLRLKWNRGDAVDIDSIFSGLAAHTSAVLFNYYPNGNVAGRPKYTGNVWVGENGFRVVGRVGEMMRAEVDLVWDNGWTRTTV